MQENPISGLVKALSRSPSHTMSKQNEPFLTLLTGLGVEGDAHMGETVKHRSRVAQDPTQPNLRQVHLIHSELHQELSASGFSIQPGQMGENITTIGLDLLGMPKGAQLLIGETAVLEVTGLRNPCHQLEGIQEGLMKAVLDRDEHNNLIRKAGIMAIVIHGGIIRTGDPITVKLPKKPYVALDKV